jgi:hypothetical protein
MALGRESGCFSFGFLSQMLLVAALFHNSGQPMENFEMKKLVWIVHWMAQKLKMILCRQVSLRKVFHRTELS